MATTNHGAGSASGKAAGDNRRDTRATARTERTEAAQPQMERKPFENGR
jgi:hypothetical protein